MRARLRLPDLDVPKPWRLAVLIVVGVVLAGLAAWWTGTGDEDGWSGAIEVRSAPAPVDP